MVVRRTVIDLSVNVNKVALLRNSRGGSIPSVVGAARIALDSGAYGITVHPRPDQRHIRPGDVADLAKLLDDEYRDAELNIEGNPFAPARAAGYPGFTALVELARPDQVTLVPDTDAQLTSDHGFDLTGENRRLVECISHYRSLGARVSLFMDPDPAQIERVADTGADRIELYTGPFAEAVRHHGVDSAEAHESFDAYRRAAECARSCGLGVNAGHDLDLVNLPLFVGIKHIQEVSIGHALIADALERGLAATIEAYIAVLSL
jgi:pyridoxine 5-phosphate synthase